MAVYMGTVPGMVNSCGLLLITIKLTGCDGGEMGGNRCSKCNKQDMVVYMSNRREPFYLCKRCFTAWDFKGEAACSQSKLNAVLCKTKENICKLFR